MEFFKSPALSGTNDINENSKLQSDNVPRPAKMQVESDCLLARNFCGVDVPARMMARLESAGICAPDDYAVVAE
jgi:hypothetical protein